MYQSISVFSLRGVMRGSVYIRQSRSALIGPLLGSLRSYWPLVTLLCRSALSLSQSEDPSIITAGIRTLIGDEIHKNEERIFSVWYIVDPLPVCFVIRSGTIYLSEKYFSSICSSSSQTTSCQAMD